MKRMKISPVWSLVVIVAVLGFAIFSGGCSGGGKNATRKMIWDTGIWDRDTWQ